MKIFYYYISSISIKTISCLLFVYSRNDGRGSVSSSWKVSKAWENVTAGYPRVPDVTGKPVENRSEIFGGKTGKDNKKKGVAGGVDLRRFSHRHHRHHHNHDQ